MTRHFWNISTHTPSTAALHRIETAVVKNAYIVDYKKFAADYHILKIEVDTNKVSSLLDDLNAEFAVEPYNKIHLNRADDDEVYLNIKILE